MTGTTLSSFFARMLTLLVVIGFGLVAGCTKDAPPPPLKPAYVIPVELQLSVNANRNREGHVVFVGTTTLPDGMKLGISLLDNRKKGVKGQDYKIFVKNGKFRSSAFSDGGKPHKKGKHKINVISHLNGAWQNDGVLNTFGNGGAKLNGDGRGLFTPSDTDVVDPDWLIDLNIDIDFPTIPIGPKLIQTVKDSVHAKKCVKGYGRRSVSEVTKVIDYKKQGKWIVDEAVSPPKVIWRMPLKSGGHSDAEWEVNGRTVKYVNKTGKTVSCFPNGD